MSKKGPQWERDFSRRLSLWFSDGDDDSWFWRTATSGGRATSRRKKGKRTRNHHGDICATCPEAQPFCEVFAVELKRGYQAATLIDLLDGGPAPYKEWIQKVQIAREEMGSYSWMLVHFRGRREPLVLMPWQMLEDLQATLPYHAARLFWESEDLALIRLEDFFEGFRPSFVRALAKEL